MSIYSFYLRKINDMNDSTQYLVSKYGISLLKVVMRKSKHILIPIDFNDTSSNLVDYVAHWMEEGDKITLLHIISHGYGSLEVTEEHGPFGELESQLKERFSRLHALYC
jgi:hypothetical protein